MKKRLLALALASVTGAATLTGCSSLTTAQDASGLVQLDSQYALERVWQVKTGALFNRDAEGLQFAEDANNLYVASSSGTASALLKEPTSRWQDQVVWQTQFASPVLSGPAKFGQHLIVGTAKGLVMSLSSETGAVEWQTQLSSEVISHAVIAEEKIFTRTVDGKLYAVDFSTGRIIWVVDHQMPELSLRGAPSVLYHDGQLYVGWESGMVQALSAQSGALLWEHRIAVPKGRTDLDRLVDIQANLVLAQGRLVAQGYNGLLTVLDAKSGDVFFEKKLSGYRDFIVDQNMIYVADAGDVLHAFDLLNGALKWRQNAFEGRGVGDLQMHKDQLLVSDSKGYLHWLNPVQGTEVTRIKHSNDHGDGDRVLRMQAEDAFLTLLSENGVVTRYAVKTSDLAEFKQAHPGPGFFESLFGSSNR